jgi:hypothetical protein
MPLATKNGAIIIEDGKLAEQCSCCGECVNVSYFTSGLFRKGCGGGGIQHGLRTIEIPSRLSVPCSVYISGGVDDDLSVDGSVVQAGQYVGGGFNDCNPAHSVCYSFTATSRTFTVAALDNYGGNTGYDLKICFAKGECNPLP